MRRRSSEIVPKRNTKGKSRDSALQAVAVCCLGAGAGFWMRFCKGERRRRDKRVSLEGWRLHHQPSSRLPCGYAAGHLRQRLRNPRSSCVSKAGLVPCKGGNGPRTRRPDKRVELLVTTNRELKMAWGDALDAEVLGGVA